MTAYFWKVEEAVGGGRFIIWPDTYSTREGAEKAIEAAKASSGARAAQYRTGRGDGPERVEAV